MPLICYSSQAGIHFHPLITFPQLYGKHPFSQSCVWQSASLCVWKKFCIFLSKKQSEKELTAASKPICLRISIACDRKWRHNTIQGLKITRRNVPRRVQKQSPVSTAQATSNRLFQRAAQPPNWTGVQFVCKTKPQLSFPMEQRGDLGGDSANRALSTLSLSE